MGGVRCVRCAAPVVGRVQASGVGFCACDPHCVPDWDFVPPTFPMWGEGTTGGMFKKKKTITV